MTASQKYLLEMGYNDLILTHPAKPRVYASKVLSDFAQLRTAELEADAANRIAMIPVWQGKIAQERNRADKAESENKRLRKALKAIAYFDMDSYACIGDKVHERAVRLNNKFMAMAKQALEGLSNE